MKIEYTVKIVNPVASFLTVDSQTKEKEGIVQIVKRDTDYLVRGYIDKGKEVVKVHSVGYVGKDYRLKERESTELEVEDNLTSLSIIDLFSIIDKKVDSTEFSKVKSHIKKVIVLENNIFKIEDYVEKEHDIFIISISKEGLIQKPTVTVNTYTNTFYCDTKDSLYYFKINRTLSLDLNDYLPLSFEYLMKMPVGFKKLSTNTYSSSSSNIIKQEDEYICYTSEESKLSSDHKILVDGYETSEYNLDPYEKVILNFKQYYKISDISINKENIYLIYKVDDDNEIVPYFAINPSEDSKSMPKEIKDFISSDEEFKKRYLCQLYKIRLTIGKEINTIYNTEVAKSLLNNFKGNIYKYE